jgi:PAS domain S-box-containing protein
MSQLFSGLRFRLLFLVLLACAPLVGWTLHTASQERRQLVKEWKLRSQEMMELATREEGQVIGQTRQLLLALAQSSSARSGNRRECKALLDELFGSYPRYANLGVVGTNGMVVASARTMVEPVNQTNRPFFRRTLATSTFAIGAFPDGQTVGKPTVNFGYPVFDSAGQVQAVVFATLDLEWVSQFESALLARLPQGATWTEIDRNGRILVRFPSPEKWIGQPFPEKSLLKAVFRQNHGVVEALSSDGIPGYHAFAAMRSQLVPDDVVTILSSIPKNVLFAEADRRLTENLTGLGVAACFAFVLGWIGSHFLILRPVRTLVKSGARLATDDLSTRTGMSHRGDELGQLTRGFDQMAQALEHREVERQTADHALKASEMRYRRLFETAQDGILILNAGTGQIDDVNPFLTDMLGYTREQLLGNKLWEIGPFKDTKASKAEFRELQREAYVRYDDLPLETSDGRPINVEFVSNVYQVNGGKVIQCNIRDITKRKQAEGKLKESRRRLQVLSRRLMEVQETERRHLARELHDEIGQALTAIELNLQALLELPGSDALTPRLKESLRVVERVQEQVDDVSLNLRPSMLDDLGLVPALRWCIERQAALAGFHAEVQADPSLEQRLDPMIETVCWRGQWP